MAAWAVLLVPTPVDIDAFVLPSRPPSIYAPPAPTVSHRVLVLLIISRTPRLIRIHRTLQISVSKMGVAPSVFGAPGPASGRQFVLYDVLSPSQHLFFPALTERWLVFQ